MSLDLYTVQIDGPELSCIGEREREISYVHSASNCYEDKSVAVSRPLCTVLAAGHYENRDDPLVFVPH